MKQEKTINGQKYANMQWGFEHLGGAGGKEPTCQCRSPKRLWFETPWGPEDLEEGMATHSSILP